MAVESGEVSIFFSRQAEESTKNAGYETRGVAMWLGAEVQDKNDLDAGAGRVRGSAGDARLEPWKRVC